jgi:hypothetical protein
MLERVFDYMNIGRILTGFKKISTVYSFLKNEIVLFLNFLIQSQNYLHISYKNQDAWLSSFHFIRALNNNSAVSPLTTSTALSECRTTFSDTLPIKNLSIPVFP